MKLRRRQFLHLAAGAAVLSTAPLVVWAQSYPTKPVRWIVGFAPAGGNDIVARLMGQWLTERLGQSFVIENRPGAATNLAAEAAINAAPDGYTLFLANVSNAINATFYTKLNFDFIRDITPVAAIMRMPNVMLGNPSRRGLAAAVTCRFAATGRRYGSTGASVSDIVKEHAERLRLNPKQFAGHSLRAGFLTSAAARGASIFKMMDVSRHRSVDTLRGYVRDAELFKDHAGAGLL